VCFGGLSRKPEGLIEESQNVGYNHNEMLKLLELSVNDYITVINKGKGKLHRY